MRIIGLDIGSYSIKAVEIESGLRAVEVLDFFEQKLPITENPPTIEQLRQAIYQLFSDHKIEAPFKLICALSGLNISSRTLTMPFTDKVKIKQTLPFELEEHIPFAPEDIVFDYQISTQTDNKSNIFTLIATHEAIKQRIDIFDRPDELSPDILSADSVALANISEYIEEPGEVYAIVSIGKSKTTACILQQGNILNLRSIGLAGDIVTQGIQNDYKLSYNDAEQAKIDNGFVLTDQTDVTADQRKFSDCIKKSLAELISQLSQTIQSHRSKGLAPVQKIFLTGQSSLLRNFSAYLSQELNIEVEHLNCLQGLDMCNIADNDKNNAAASTALSLGIGLVGRSYSEQFDFRKGDFAKFSGGAIGKEVRTLLAAGALIIGIMLMNIFGNYFILKSTLNQVDEQIASTVKKFPIKIKSSLLDSPTRLRAFLNKKAKEQKEKLNALGGQKSQGLTVLQVVKEVSSAVPKEVLFDVREMSIVDRKVRLKAISDSFNTIENIEKSFTTNKDFRNVVKGEISTSADGKNKNFTISFDIRKKKK